VGSTRSAELLIPAVVSFQVSLQFTDIRLVRKYTKKFAENGNRMVAANAGCLKLAYNIPVGKRFLSLNA
jgi:hypothetical protein